MLAAAIANRADSLYCGLVRRAARAAGEFLLVFETEFAKFFGVSPLVDNAHAATDLDFLDLDRGRRGAFFESGGGHGM